MVQIRGVIEEDPVPDFLRYRGRWLEEQSKPAVSFWLPMTCWLVFALAMISIVVLDAVLSSCPLWLIDSVARTVQCVG